MLFLLGIGKIIFDSTIFKSKQSVRIKYFLSTESPVVGWKRELGLFASSGLEVGGVKVGR